MEERKSEREREEGREGVININVILMVLNF